MATYYAPTASAEYIFYISLVSQSTGLFQASPTLASGDFKVSMDGAALANLTTLPTNTPSGSVMVKVTLSAAEMAGANITVVCRDAAGAQWTDQQINIHTSPADAVVVSEDGSQAGARCISARDLITRALRLLGVYEAGETPSPEDLSDGLEALNDMLDDWATQQLTSPYIKRTTWTIVSGTAAYTIGDGGTVNIARPTALKQIQFVDTSTDPDTEYPLAYLTDDAYAGLTQKAVTSLYPSAAYYQSDTAVLGRITLWPVPTSSTLLGVVYAPSATPYFDDLSSVICFRPAYVRAMRFNLAVELAPEFDVTPSDGVLHAAADGLANLKRSNIRLSDLSVDLALRPRGRWFNIYTG